MNKRRVVIALLLLLALLLFLLLMKRGPSGLFSWIPGFAQPATENLVPGTQLVPVIPGPLPPVLPPIHHPGPTVSVPHPVVPHPKQVNVSSAPAVEVSTSTIIIKPAKAGLHPELIPKEITIVRCYYDQEVVAPGYTLGFDINGSGFNEAFQQMITVDLDALDIQVTSLKLVTANQIHGEISVGPEATTQYVNPKILIKRLPVFKAEDPFGVVRRGEVLDIVLTSIDESGQSGRFRIITNLDPGLLKGLRVTPTTPKLEIGTLSPQLPFHLDGELRIAPGLSSGEYGLAAYFGTHELLKKDPLVDVVRPDVGRTGSVSSLKTSELAHRPGDLLQLTIQGSGFAYGDTRFLTAQVEEFDMGQASFTYISPGRIDLSMQIPLNAPVGTYSMSLRHKRKTIYQKKMVFGIVPTNWLSGVHLSQPISPGQKGQVQLLGRDLSPDFIRSLHVDTDEPGLQVSAPRLQDNSTAVSEVQVSTAVAPGDYLIHITASGRNLRLPKGNIIKINP